MTARRTIWMLLLGILAGRPLLAGGNHWTSGTPPWGPQSVLGVTAHPRIPGLVFARGEGLWRSDDGGENWSRLPLPQAVVLTVAPDPSSADVVYVDRTSGGVLRSADGGRTWVPAAADATSPPVVSQLTIAPSAPEVLFAYGLGRAGAGLYRSRDSGETWQLAFASSAFVGVAIDPFDARNVIIAAADQGVLRSSDGGDHWVPTNTGLLALSATSIAIDAQDARRLYLINAGQIYRSTDAGGTWLPTSGIANPVEVSSDPLEANLAYARTGATAGFDGLVRTTDGGFTWRAISPPPGVRSLNGLAPDPGHSGSLYVVTDRVLKTSDAGTTWSTLGAGPADVAARGLAVSPFDAATVYAAGGLARFSRSPDSGASWLVPANAGFPSAPPNNLAVGGHDPGDRLRGNGLRPVPNARSRGDLEPRGAVQRFHAHPPGYRAGRDTDCGHDRRKLAVDRRRGDLEHDLELGWRSRIRQTPRGDGPPDAPRHGGFRASDPARGCGRSARFRARSADSDAPRPPIRSTLR